MVYALKNKLLTSKHGGETIWSFIVRRISVSFAFPENYDFQTCCFGFRRQYTS